MAITTKPDINGDEFFILLLLVSMPFVPFLALLHFLVYP